MKKIILSVCVILSVLCSCSAEKSEFEAYSNAERALLCNFIEYCQNIFEDRYEWNTNSDDKTLRFIARHYVDKFEFADVTDYERQTEVDYLIYTEEEMNH